MPLRPLLANNANALRGFLIRPESRRSGLSLLALLAFCALNLGLLPKLMAVGATWASQAHPIPAVEVRLANGHVLRGSLSRTWSGQLQLVTAQGTFLLDDDQYHSLRFPPAATTPALPWRLWLPSILLLALQVPLLGRCLRALVGHRRPSLSTGSDQ